MLELRTLNDIFFRLAARREAPAMLHRTAGGAWEPISGSEVHRRVVAFASALLSLGIVKGDRVGLLAENRWEWAVTDFALLAIGAVGVPIYPTLTADQTEVMLKDSGCRIAVVSTRRQQAKVAGFRDGTDLEHIVVMDDEDLPDTLQFSALVAVAYDSERTPRAAADDIYARARAVAPYDLATIIYTSGTTGEPKGVMLTHRNLAANLNYSAREYTFDASDSCISFLPLSHITARHLDYVMLARGATLAYCPFFEQLPAAMTSVRPTVFVAVPRVYEKVMQEVKRRAARSALKARMLSLALAIGGRATSTVMAGEVPTTLLWKMADRLVFSKVRQVFGGRVKCFVCGGAPLGSDTGMWFASAGIQLLEGYGLTETSPVIALSSPRSARIGSVGRPVPNIELRFAGDGELLVRGPSVFSSYWRKPDATAQAFEEGEWFHTGDVAQLDEDGFLFITDRKKEMLKTSGGKMIAPQPIENKLKADSLVAHAALVGDRHKFACALIAPNFSALEEWAHANGIDTTARAGLVVHPQVKSRYHQIIQSVNAQLANFEKIKRFYVVPDEWTIETGEMTPSMKLKRRVILERYANEIAHFYADEAVAHG
ncbi:MAG TPA: long-chain fatty acid--CoA ligase [Acidisarcina sp.]